MPGSTRIDAETAVSLLAEGTDEPYRLVRRLIGAETGAHQVIGPEGRVLVLKWDTDPRSQELRREAVVLTERLRAEAGWPRPDGRCRARTSSTRSVSGFAVAFEGLDELCRQTYLAHLSIRFLDWSIRGCRSEEIDFWLARADEMLSV
jgi:hypothetical protein